MVKLKVFCIGCYFKHDIYPMYVRAHITLIAPNRHEYSTAAAPKHSDYYLLNGMTDT